MYAVMLFLVTIVGWIMLSPWVVEKMHNVPFCTNSTVPGIPDYHAACQAAVGHLAVYRVMFAMTIFFLVFALIMIGVKSSKDGRASIQNGYLM